MRNFTQRVRLASWLGLFFLLAAPAWAQYNTPTLDGNIGSGEYGTQTDGQNRQITNNGNTAWYMTYDANYLYIGITGINGSDASFTYLDVNPIVPVTGGSNSDGNLTGINYDAHNFSVLPFRADYAVYTNGGSQQLLRSAGNGNWTSVGSGAGVVDSYFGNGNRELRIAWTTLGGRPASYNWLGYASYQSGTAYLFGAVPTGNLSPTATNVAGSTTLKDSFYYAVSTVADGGTKPFSQNSYTFPGTGSVNAFGAFTIYDFTMNTSGQYISRGCSGGDWSIAGTLTVGDGSVYFGSNGAAACSSHGTTNVGNVRVVGGLLDMDYTYNSLVVNGNVSLSGGTLKLSNTSGGDLRIAGNLSFTGGTFNAANRAIFLTGTSQTLAGTNLSLPYLVMAQANAGGTATLGSDVAVTTQLSFGTGSLLTGSYVLNLGTAGVLSGETASSNLVGYARATRTVGSGGTGAVNFGNLGLTLSPVNSSAALGATEVTRSRGVGSLSGQGTSKSINRNFRIAPANTAGPFDVALRFDYFDAEIPAGTMESNLQLFYSNNAVTYPASGGGRFYRQDVDSRDTNANYVVRNDATEFTPGVVYTLGDQTNPLPVTLVSFGGRRVGSTRAVRLDWLTGLEVNNSGFSVERQAATGEWQAVAFVPGTGSSQGRSYEYVDAKAPASQLYYRLRQLDADGTASYSRVVAVAAAGGSEVALTLSPVPAPASPVALTVDLSALPATPRTLTVYDLQGRLVVQTTAPAEAATAELPVAELAAGTYVVQVRTSTGNYRTRFVKL